MRLVSNTHAPKTKWNQDAAVLENTHTADAKQVILVKAQDGYSIVKRFVSTNIAGSPGDLYYLEHVSVTCFLMESILGGLARLHYGRGVEAVAGDPTSYRRDFWFCGNEAEIAP